MLTFLKNEEIFDGMQGKPGKRVFNTSAQGCEQGEHSQKLTMGPKFKRVQKIPSMIKKSHIQYFKNKS